MKYQRLGSGLLGTLIAVGSAVNPGRLEGMLIPPSDNIMREANNSSALERNSARLSLYYGIQALNHKNLDEASYNIEQSYKIFDRIRNPAGDLDLFRALVYMAKLKNEFYKMAQSEQRRDFLSEQMLGDSLVFIESAIAEYNKMRKHLGSGLLTQEGSFLIEGILGSLQYFKGEKDKGNLPNLFIDATIQMLEGVTNEIK